MIFRPKRAIFSLVGGAAAFLATGWIGMQINFPNPFSFAFEPGNSLRPIRSSIPYLIAVLSYLLIRQLKIGFWRDILAGLIIGTSLLWSNDYAVPTAGIFSLLLLMQFYLNENSTARRSSVAFILATCICWALLLSAITLGHSFELIDYNFIDVATDQWWYFGPYGSTTRVFDIRQIFRVFSQQNYFPVVVLIASLIFSTKTKELGHVLVSAIGLTLFAGGSLASLGGHLGGYFEAFYYWGAMSTTLVILRSTQIFLFRISRFKPQRFFLNQSLLIVTFLLFLSATFSFDSYEEKISSAKNDPGRYFVPELGGYLGLEWKDYIDYAQQHKKSKVIEEYWGLWSALNRTFPRWPVDSVIHALGNTRWVAERELVNADIIISTRYQTSPQWQPWSLSQNFWFYEPLLLNWEPEFISPTTIVWRRTKNLREYKKINCKTSSTEKGFSLDSEELGFYKVTLNYQSSAAGRYLLMVQNNISYALDANGYVSLPLNRSTVTIPALITEGSGNFFKTKIYGGDDVSLEIKSCSAAKISYTNNEVLYVKSENDFFLTDGNWVRGIARRSAAFFVPNKRPYTEYYKVGKFVFFPNMDFRKITEVIHNGIYLNVRVEGPALDPDRVGWPTDFEAVDASRVSQHPGFRTH